MQPGAFKNIFGKPGEGIHKYRLFGVAAADLMLTIFISVLISIAFNWNIILVFAVAMSAGIAAHRAFRVNTALNMKIFGKLSG